MGRGVGDELGHRTSHNAAKLQQILYTIAICKVVFGGDGPMDWHNAYKLEPR